MKDLRRAYNMAWTEAERMGGDFQDCLLSCLSKNLGMPILNEVRNGSTDEGIEEMCRGVPASSPPETHANRASDTKEGG